MGNKQKFGVSNNKAAVGWAFPIAIYKKRPKKEMQFIYLLSACFRALIHKYTFLHIFLLRCFFSHFPEKLLSW